MSRISQMLILVASIIATIGGRATADGPPKHALLVAVNGYADPKKHGADEKNRWWDLNTTSDVVAIKESLMTHFGFKENEIHVIQTPDETKHDAIIDAFRKYLIMPTSNGDIIYFHYSGHGTTASDSGTILNGKPYKGNTHPNDKPNGQDQTLIPSDYASKKDPSNNIFGDEIGDLLKELSDKKPGSVMLTFDCCFAGTNTRGGRMLVRGALGEVPPNPDAPKDDGLGKQQVGAVDPGAQLYGFNVLTATRSNQLATEYQDGATDMGLFTYALVRAMNETAAQTSYADLFARIRAIMARESAEQEPIMEGPERLAVLGTAPVTAAMTYFTGKDKTTSLPIVRAGRVHGMTQGTTLTLYKPGADTSKDAPLTEATVDSVNATTSTLKLANENIDTDLLLGGKAVVKERAYPDKPLFVAADKLAGHPRATDIMKALREMENKSKTIKIVSSVSNAWDVLLRPAETDSGAQLGDNSAQLQLKVGGLLQYNTVKRGDPHFISDLPDTPELPQRIQELIERESRRQMVTDLANESPQPPMHVNVRVIPIAMKRDANNKVLRDPKTHFPVVDHEIPVPTGGSPMSLAIGDYFEVEVENTGTETVYVTVLDLTPDGGLKAIFPGTYTDPENRLDPGQKKRVRTKNNVNADYVVTVPEGKEVIKVIVTDEKTDFSMLVDEDPVRLSRGEVSETAKKPLGKWLLNAHKRNQTRGDLDVGVLPGNWTTADRVILVVDPTKKVK